MFEDSRLRKGPGVDRFTPFGHGVGYIPVRNRKLAAQAMCNVRIISYRILVGNHFSKVIHKYVYLRPMHHAGQPIW